MGPIALAKSRYLPIRNRCLTFVLLCELALAGCAHKPPDIRTIRANNDREIQSLLDLPTPDHLAAASVVEVRASVLEGRLEREVKTDPSMKLIERAEALAPLQPDLVWLQLAHCRRLQCDASMQIEDHLKTIDPGNGFVWLSDLERAQASGSQAAVNEAILRIGSSSRMTFYLNELEVMLVDALAAAEPSESLVTRGGEAIGLLAATAIPPLQPMSKACQLEQFDVPGRRAACESMFARMEHSSSVLTQSLALSVQRRWWPAGSAQREALLNKHRRLDYLMTVSSRVRLWHMNRDMAVRLDAARRTEREEDVEIAIVKSFGLSTDPPADWKDPYDSRQ
jgi:hypothetical protein